MEMYKEFKRFFGNHAASRELLFYIQENGLEEEMVAFYPVNWFEQESPPEMYIFTRVDIVRVLRDHRTLNVDVYKDYKVLKLTYFENLNDRYAGSKLDITLQSGDHLVLDASKTNNEDWVVNLSEYIKNIYTILK